MNECNKRENKKGYRDKDAVIIPMFFHIQTMNQLDKYQVEL